MQRERVSKLTFIQKRQHGPIAFPCNVLELFFLTELWGDTQVDVLNYASFVKPA